MSKKRGSKTLQALGNYFTDGRSKDLSPTSAIPRALLDLIPDSDPSARSLLVRWFTDYVDGVTDRLDMERVERLTKKYNLASAFWDAYRGEAESRRAALRIPATIERREAREDRDRDHEEASHTTRMLEEQLRQAELRKRIEELSRPPSPPKSSERSPDDTIRDRVATLLADLKDFAVADVAIEGVAVETRDQARANGGTEAEAERAYRLVKNTGRQMLQEIARDHSKKPVTPGDTQ